MQSWNKIYLVFIFSSPSIGGIAQWQSIRLQIERSPVQLRLPPNKFLYFFKFFFFQIEESIIHRGQNWQKSKGPTEVLMSSYILNNFNFFLQLWSTRRNIHNTSILFILIFYFLLLPHSSTCETLADPRERQGRPPSCPNSFIFMRFSAKLLPNNRFLPTSRVGGPPI